MSTGTTNAFHFLHIFLHFLTFFYFGSVPYYFYNRNKILSILIKISSVNNKPKLLTQLNLTLLFKVKVLYTLENSKTRI